ncbi:hypothetical protein KSF78_0004913 [Schistosoma japonicum]|nr:hypothetical protein KSF78_0004913 [Schistosoma japonicum]
MNITFFFLLFLVTMSVIYADKAADLKELERIKKTPEFKATKAKIMAKLEDKIDQLVLDQLRKNKK